MTLQSEVWNASLKAIIAAASKSQGGNIQYAASYARAGLGMIGEERRVQALYILSNLSGWRGEEAKAVKEALKSFSLK